MVIWILVTTPDAYEQPAVSLPCYVGVSSIPQHERTALRHRN